MVIIGIYLAILFGISGLLFFLASWQVAVLVAGIIILSTNVIVHFLSGFSIYPSSDRSLQQLVAVRYTVGGTLFLLGVISLIMQST